MNYPKFVPEGWNENLPEITKDNLTNAIEENSIIQGKVSRYDANYNLYVDFGNNLTGIIPRDEIEAIRFKQDKLPNYRNCANKVNKIVQFKVKEIKDNDTVILSRKAVGKEAINWVRTELNEGEEVCRNS